MKHITLPGIGAILLLASAAGLALYGQPDLHQKWEFLEPKYGPRLIDRQVQIDPGELLGLTQDDYIKLLIIDVRPESDWNVFHLKDAERIPREELPRHRKRFASLPENAVVVLVSNDETWATEAWKDITVLSRPNAYILEGGLNHWLNVYGYPQGHPPDPTTPNQPNADETLRHKFRLALGSRHLASAPDPHSVPERKFTAKVKLVKKIEKKGGCG